MAFKVGSETVIDSNGAVFKHFYKNSGTITSTVQEITCPLSGSGDRYGETVKVSDGLILVKGKDEVLVTDLKGNEVYDGFVVNDSDLAGAAIGSGMVLIGDTTKFDSDGRVDFFSYEGFSWPNSFYEGRQDSDTPQEFGKTIEVGSGRVVIGSNRSPRGELDFLRIIVERDVVSGSVQFLPNIMPIKTVKLDTNFELANPNDNISINCGRVAVGRPIDSSDGVGSYLGRVDVFDLNGNEIAKLRGSTVSGNSTTGSKYGTSVAVNDGLIVVGAPGSVSTNNDSDGQVFVHDLNGNEKYVIVPSDGTVDDRFGTSVAIGNGVIAVGSPRHNTSGFDIGSLDGAVYLYDYEGNLKEKISNQGSSNAQFGSSLDIGCNRLVVGAERQDKPGSGQAGGAFIFKLDERLDDHYNAILHGHGAYDYDSVAPLDNTGLNGNPETIPYGSGGNR